MIDSPAPSTAYCPQSPELWDPDALYLDIPLINRPAEGRTEHLDLVS